MVSAILLAAGESKRMGRPKQLLPWEGGTLLRHCLESLVGSAADEIILVLGHEADRIRQSLPPFPIKIVINPEYRQGMASSLRQGVLATEPRSEAFMVFLADQPGIGPALIDTLIRAFQRAAPARGIIRPVHRGRAGHPVLIGSQYRQSVLNLRGDEGARRILADNPGDILDVAVDQDAILRDIDTPEEYRDYGKRQPHEGAV